MTRQFKTIAICGTLALLGACSTVKTASKIATLPVKGVMKTGQLTGKGVYQVGKGAYYTGKGAYKVASVPVKMTNAALDTSIKVLTVTTQVVDLSGKVVNVSRTMQRHEVDGYITQAKGAANVLGIFVDVAGKFAGS